LRQERKVEIPIASPNKKEPPMTFGQISYLPSSAAPAQDPRTEPQKLHLRFDTKSGTKTRRRGSTL
jgi:hypothetical protein